jgi:hypothetical protein
MTPDTSRNPLARHTPPMMVRRAATGGPISPLLLAGAGSIAAGTLLLALAAVARLAEGVHVPSGKPQHRSMNSPVQGDCAVWADPCNRERPRSSKSTGSKWR